MYTTYHHWYLSNGVEGSANKYEGGTGARLFLYMYSAVQCVTTHITHHTFCESWILDNVKERKKGQKPVSRVVKKLPVALGTIIKHVCVVPCRITVKFSVDSSTIVHRCLFPLSFPEKRLGPATKSDKKSCPPPY